MAIHPPPRRGARAPRAEAAAVPRPLAVAAGWSWRLLVVAAAAVVVAVLALSRLRVVVLPVLAALLLAAALQPLVDLLVRRRVPRTAAVWGVLLAAAGVVAGLGFLAVERTRGQFGDLQDRLDAGVTDVEDWLVDGPLGLSRGRVDDITAGVRDAITPSGDGLASGVVGGAMLALEILAGILLTLVLLFFVLKDGPRMWDWIVGRVGADAGRHVDAAGRRAWAALSGWIRGTALVATIDAVLIGAGIAALGVPLLLPLTLLTFVGAFLPIVGAFVAGAAAVLVALADKGLVTALILLGVVVAVQQIEGNVLAPLILGSAVNVHPVVILFALGAGGAIGGIVGAFLAVPTTAVVVAVAGYAWPRIGPDDQPPPPGGDGREEPP